jgi:hypothetical protein
MNEQEILDNLPNSKLNIFDVSSSSYIRYRMALWSFGGEDYWIFREQEKWVDEQYGSAVIEALQIASGLKNYC